MRRTRASGDTATLDLFEDDPVLALPASMSAPVVQAACAAEVLAQLHDWADASLLRRLDSALARFVHEHDAAAAPCVLAAVAVLAQMEGRGHSCLPLAELVATPQAVLGWSAAEGAGLQALWARLPARLPDWLAALAACSLVRVPGRDADLGQPLVLAPGGAGGGAGTRPPALLYLRRYWNHERLVAEAICQRSQPQALETELDPAQVRHWLERFFPAVPGAGCDWQKVACALALRGRIAVITGGPGTGKTHTAARLLALLLATAPDATRLRVALAAPTGKAAARLKQAIDDALGGLQQQVGEALDLQALLQRMGPARTLHALLGARPGTRQFARHAGHPLELDVLIVDEASMVHLEMMSALLAALPPTARLVLLGDKDQLASVEAGAVMGDLCRGATLGRYGSQTARWVEQATGEQLPSEHLAADGQGPALAQQTVMLRASRRFGGPIGELAAAVNRGDATAALAAVLGSGGVAGAGLVDVTAPVALAQGAPLQALVRLALHGRGDAAPGYGPYARALARWAQVRPLLLEHDSTAHTAWACEVLTAFERFRLLCAVREGDWGVAGLNRAVEQALEHAGHLRRHGEWYAGRPVMVTRNDPALGVFNGDIGIALPGVAPGHALRVFFLQGGQLRSVGVARLAQVETAFAMTVHKAQGSEFEHAALVLAGGAAGALGRELVYTGITRARKAFTLVAERAGLLQQAIGQPTRRASGLEYFLSDAGFLIAEGR